jgi:DNA-binding response OmpR family regulator
VIAARRVLLVTGVPEQFGALTLALRAAGYRVDIVAGLADEVPLDLALVDVRGGANWHTAEFLASRRLMLVVDGPAAMQRGFALGAEECILDNAHPDEVVARCDAVLRRTSARPTRAPGEPVVYVDRRLWVNFHSRQVWVGERAARLTPREFRLLGHLLRHRDRTIGHDEILQAVWSRPPDSERPAEVLKQYIWRLRQKIEVDPDAPEIIVTDPGEGYRFVSHLE